MLNLKQLLTRNKGLFNIFQRFGSYSPFPLYLGVYTTLNCNCNCLGCFQRSDQYYMSKNGFLSRENFRKILSMAKEFFIKPLIHLSGGEPLLNAEFPGFMRDLKDKGFSCSIVTNGAFLDKLVPIYADAPIKQINVSIDSIGEKHDQRRKVPGLFEKVINNIRQLAAVPGKKRYIMVNCVIGPDNYSSLAAFADHFRDNFEPGVINGIMFQHFMYSDDSRDIAGQIRADVLLEQMRELEFREYPFSVGFIPDLKKETVPEYYGMTGLSRAGNCNIPWLGLNIFPTMDVAFGGGMYACNRIIGSLNSDSLKNIWNNEQMRQFRKLILDKGIPDACACCCHRQYP